MNDLAPLYQIKSLAVRLFGLHCNLVMKQLLAFLSKRVDAGKTSYLYAY